jgi:hypothetical protein
MIAASDSAITALAPRRPVRSAAERKRPGASQAQDDEAKKKGWIVVSMKDDWKKVCAFE